MITSPYNPQENELLQFIMPYPFGYTMKLIHTNEVYMKLQYSFNEECKWILMLQENQHMPNHIPLIRQYTFGIVDRELLLYQFIEKDPLGGSLLKGAGYPYIRLPVSAGEQTNWEYHMFDNSVVSCSSQFMKSQVNDKTGDILVITREVSQDSKNINSIEYYLKGYGLFLVEQC